MQIGEVSWSRGSGGGHGLASSSVPLMVPLQVGVRVGTLDRDARDREHG